MKKRKQGIWDLKKQFKSEALKHIQRLNCTWEYDYSEYNSLDRIMIDLPEGYEYDGCTCLISFDWEDVVERLKDISDTSEFELSF